MFIHFVGVLVFSTEMNNTAPRRTARDIRFVSVVDVRDFVAFRIICHFKVRNEKEAEVIQVIVGDNTIFVLFSLFSSLFFSSSLLVLINRFFLL